MGRKVEATLWMLIEQTIGQNEVKKYVRVEQSKNGKWHLKKVRGNYTEGSYYLRYTAPAGKRKWESVGTDLLIAQQDQKARQTWLDQRLAPTPLDSETPSRRTLAEATIKFLADKSGQSRTERKRLQDWKWILNLYSSWWDKVYLDEFTREDFLSFRTYLKSRDLSPRTARNNLSSIVTFLRATGWVVCPFSVPYFPGHASGQFLRPAASRLLLSRFRPYATCDLNHRLAISETSVGRSSACKSCKSEVHLNAFLEV